MKCLFILALGYVIGLLDCAYYAVKGRVFPGSLFLLLVLVIVTVCWG